MFNRYDFQTVHLLTEILPLLYIEKFGLLTSFLGNYFFLLTGLLRKYCTIYHYFRYILGVLYYFPLKYFTVNGTNRQTCVNCSGCFVDASLFFFSQNNSTLLYGRLI